MTVTKTLQHEELPPPRRVRARPWRSWAWGFLIFLVPHVWVGVFLLGAAVFELVETVRFSLYSHDVPGRVSRLEVRRSKGRVSHWVHFTYREGLTDARAEAAVDEAGFGLLAEGQVVDVRILPGSRAGPYLLARGVSGPWAKLGAWWMITLFWDGFMAFLVWNAFGPRLRHRSLVRHGVAARGEVTDVVENRPSRGPRTFTIRYHFRAPPPDGVEEAEWQGKMTVKKLGPVEAPVGSRHTVLYDPRRPRRSLLYRFADYQALAPDGSE
jgi:hypothetical protein